MKNNKSIKLKNSEVNRSLKAKNSTKKMMSKNKQNTVEKVEKLVKEKTIKVIAKDLVKVNAVEAKSSRKKDIQNDKKVELKPIESPVLNFKVKNEKITEKDLTRIAKKKAKKLLQKLKKKQKKELEEIAIGKIKESDKTNKNLSVAKKEPLSTEKIEPKQINPKKQRKIEKKKLLNDLKDDEEEQSKRVPVDFEVATVFVGNLPVNTKRIQLVNLFAKYGPVSAIRLRTAGGKCITRHKQRKQAGTLNAYVVLKDEATADMALELNGNEFKTNHLRVTRASKNEHNAENVDAKNMVFVGNLKYSATEEKLREIFSSCGEIEYVRCIHDGEKGCKGVAYVCFKAPDAVGLALELNETMLDERPIHVERYSAKKLGAKEARDNKASAQGTKKTVTGAKKRLEIKKKKQSGKAPTTSEDSNDKKKFEFRGVKVNDIKQKQKKKKPSSQLKQLAKKIAPKTK